MLVLELRSGATTVLVAIPSLDCDDPERVEWVAASAVLKHVS